VLSPSKSPPQQKKTKDKLTINAPQFSDDEEDTLEEDIVESVGQERMKMQSVIKQKIDKDQIDKSFSKEQQQDNTT
tara:strand:+ start:599 stop:826 length:228 start_codon:yes stop_codon:yes gene_type:complete